MTITITTMTKGRINKKVVTFHTHADVRLTLHINEYTSSEVMACWYSDAEREMNRQDVRATLVQIRRRRYDKKAAMTTAIHNNGHENIDDDEDDILFCQRGLESIVGDAREAKVLNRQLACEAVLNLQDEQWMTMRRTTTTTTSTSTSMIDPYEIAARYVKFCKKDRAKAYLRGCCDAKVAERINQRERSISSSSSTIVSSATTHPSSDIKQKCKKRTTPARTASSLLRGVVALATKKQKKESLASIATKYHHHDDDHHGRQDHTTRRSSSTTTTTTTHPQHRLNFTPAAA